MKKRKLLLIGWDAADWEVIDQLMLDGKMPTLASFLKRGVRGNIATLSPSLSPILWTSIATGKRAYDHGICGFVESLPDQGRVVPVRSTTRKCKAVWNILNEAGLRTNVVNWWPSYPAEVVQGVSVSNHYHLSPPPYGEQWRMDHGSIYPEHYQKTLEEFRVHPAELGLAHITPFIPDAARLDPEKDPVLKSCLRILAHSSSNHNAATWLMEHTEWDFMAIYQEAIDHFSHLAMKYHPPRLHHIDLEEFERYRYVITAAYRFHDMMLQRLLELAGPECDVMLISDHGFQSGQGRISELPDIPAAPALEHRRYGVFAAAGPSFRSESQLYGASLLDIAPTILHHFSLPVGEDMEGQVQLNLFRNKHPISRIPSWEITGHPFEFTDIDSVNSADTLRQLEQLGYVELPENNKAEYVRRELLYNRNLSLLEGGHFNQVVKEISSEWEERHELRFGLLLARALQNLQLVDDWSKLITQLRKHFHGNGVVIFQSGMLALAQNDFHKALHFFSKLEDTGVASVQLFVEIARAYMVMTMHKNAIDYFDKALAMDPGSTMAMTGMAQVLMEQDKLDDALELLDKSLGMLFFQPQAHYLMGNICWQKGLEETASKALQICLEQAPGHQLARKLLARIRGIEDDSAPEPVIVVSGWPRSGTSMMMRMLAAGGVELFADSTRASDQFNPDGYFEHPKVLKIGENHDWLPEVRGKAVKIVLPLLRYLPASENYRVVIMRRPLTAVVVSQETMKGEKREEVMKNFPFQTALNLQKEEERMERWLRSQAHMAVHYIDLETCVHEPVKVITELAAFLGKDLDLSKAAEIPKRNAQKTKLGE
jgi:predicted AlkP superfamily phosphohydrolase/phosphomutase/tetratricopeptide (TPR) repeat protein